VAGLQCSFPCLRLETLRNVNVFLSMYCFVPTDFYVWLSQLELSPTDVEHMVPSIHPIRT
jgi:hypothetical protein